MQKNVSTGRPVGPGVQHADQLRAFILCYPPFNLGSILSTTVSNKEK